METVGRSGARRLAAVVGIILALLVAPLAAGWLTPAANLAPWRLGDAALTLVPDDGGSSDRGSLSGAPSPDSPVSLPDPWNRKHPGFGGTGHYRFTIRVEPDALADRVSRALIRFKAEYPNQWEPALVVAGGVAANRALKATLEGLRRDAGFRFVAPPLKLCTDNAAMIAWAGIERIRAGVAEENAFSFVPRSRWPLDQVSAPVIGAGRRGAKA